MATATLETATEPAAVSRVRAVFVQACAGERQPPRQDVMAAVYDQQFEWEMLRPTRAATERLSVLADLIRLTPTMRLSERDRRTIADELERMAVRIFKSERLFERVVDSAAGPADKAGILLNLLRCAPPLGDLSRELLTTALALLNTPEARLSLAQSHSLRQRLASLLP